MTAKVWTVERVAVYPVYKDHENLVRTVDWKVTGVEGEYSAIRYGTVGIPYVSENPYVPFESLTQEQIVGWVKDALGADQVALHEAFIDKSILDKLNPSIVNIRTSWGA